jgi:hypothetical protein
MNLLNGQERMKYLKLIPKFRKRSQLLKACFGYWVLFFFKECIKLHILHQSQHQEFQFLL